MNPIEAAVLPLKAEAQDRAEKEARELVAKIAAALEEHGWDAEKFAPFPRFGVDGVDGVRVFGYNDKAGYQAAQAKSNLVSRLTVSLNNSRRMGDPRPVRMDEALVEKFVTAMREEAAAQYEAFVGKLVVKIGECVSATLCGNHVWSYSTLMVTKPDGSQQAWKTQTIVNYSKYGTPFYQWPTRQVKR